MVETNIVTVPSGPGVSWSQSKWTFGGKSCLANAGVGYGGSLGCHLHLFRHCQIAPMKSQIQVATMMNIIGTMAFL